MGIVHATCFCSSARLHARPCIAALLALSQGSHSHVLSQQVKYAARTSLEWGQPCCKNWQRNLQRMNTIQASSLQFLCQSVGSLSELVHRQLLHISTRDFVCNWADVLNILREQEDTKAKKNTKINAALQMRAIPRIIYMVPVKSISPSGRWSDPKEMTGKRRSPRELGGLPAHVPLLKVIV